MNQRERVDMLRCVYSYMCARADIPILCKTQTLWSPKHIPNFSTICPAVPQIRKRNAHVRTYTCTHH